MCQIVDGPVTIWVQAAVYGRAFVAADAFSKDGIISIARKLRILNALREPEVRTKRDYKSR